MRPSISRYISFVGKDKIVDHLSKNYVKFELFDENKYDSNYNVFDAKFDEFPTIEKFIHVLITFSIPDTTEQIKYLAVEPDMDGVGDNGFPNNDFSKFAQYCRCGKCLTSKWNPFKIFKCGCCHGCLYSVFPSSSVLKNTIKYMRDNNIQIC